MTTKKRGPKIQGTEKKVVKGIRIQPSDLKKIEEKFGSFSGMVDAVLKKL